MNKELLKKLSEAVGLGHITEAAEIAKAELLKYGTVRDFGSIGLIAEIDKGKEKTVMLEAHIDEVGFIVTHVFESGFLKVSNVGGNDGGNCSIVPYMFYWKNIFNLSITKSAYTDLSSFLIAIWLFYCCKFLTVMLFIILQFTS